MSTIVGVQIDSRNIGPNLNTPAFNLAREAKNNSYVAQTQQLNNINRPKITTPTATNQPQPILNMFKKRHNNTDELARVSAKGRARNNFNISKPEQTTRSIAKTSQAQSANAQAALDKKLSALQKAQITAVKMEHLPDGRVRYYEIERASKTSGPTRGASFVTEYNPKTGQVRSWNECYDHNGKVNRIHPKTIDGQDLHSQHYPPTKAELDAFSSSKPRGPKS